MSEYAERILKKILEIISNVWTACEINPIYIHTYMISFNKIINYYLTKIYLKSVIIVYY